MPVKIGEVDATKTVNALKKIAKDQWPFAESLALTKLAQDGQKAVQQKTRNEFNLSTEFIPRGIAIKPAKKSDARRGMARSFVLTKKLVSEFMPAHEFGGTKTPTVNEDVDKGSYLALPARDLKRKAYKTKSGRVRDRWRPSALLEQFNQLGPEQAARLRGKRKRFGPRPYFITRLGSGTPAIVRRRPGRKQRGLLIFYVLVKQAKIKERWRAEPAVQEIVLRNYKARFTASVNHAFRTAK